MITHTKTLAMEDFPSSAPRLSVAFTSKPYTFPASVLKLAIALTCPVMGSIAKRRDSPSGRPKI